MSIYKGKGLEEKTTLYLNQKTQEGPPENVKFKVQATRGGITQASRGEITQLKMKV